MKYFLRSIFILLCVFNLALSPKAQQTDSIRIELSTTNVYDSVHINDSSDQRPRNSYGDLLDDDPNYNPRYPWTTTLLRVTASNVFGWAFLRYVKNAPYARVNFDTWKANLKNGTVWDRDDFSTNFLSHPHAGSDYFNVARSNGYSFWGSYPFAIIGSLQWEFFGENEPPSRNDLINTPISGAFLGEVLFRISSNILDDRRRGKNRVWREVFAGVVNPSRALNRLTQGKMWRVTPYDIYQQEPLNVTVSAGAHRVNVDNKFASGGTNVIFNLQLDYGDPFEVRRRKPFDVFRVRFESRYGENKRFIDNIIGHGILFGRTFKTDKAATLIGAFQHYDYWNNKVFELGTLGFGAGLISRMDIGRNSQWYSGLHLVGVPLAGNSTRTAPDSSELRSYPFGGGFQGRIEQRLNISKWVSLGFNGYYYWIFNYEGSKGKSRIGILKPFITVKIYRGLSLGLEHHIYYDNRFIDKLPAFHQRTTEQKLYLQYFFQDRRRYGRYH